jgi:hypothetical protein
MKPRLFVFGDSWSLDYFKEPFLTSKEVKRYSNFYNGDGHWTYHLKEFFDVHNYSIGAASIENIIYQMGNLPEYKQGDRIIIIFGSPGRFSWIENNEDIRYTLGRKNKMLHPLESQYIARIEYWKTDNNQKKFISKLNTFLKEYNPIISSWNEDFTFSFNFVKYLNLNLTTIYDESFGDCNDRHLGVNGNYELFKYFAKELKLNIKDYIFDVKPYKKQII